MPANLQPTSQTSAIVLPSTGTYTDVSGSVPFGMYTGSSGFLSGASAQVGFIYRKLGGDVVDIEITTANVYSAYEEAVLEYSYIVNLHQGKNILSDALGDTTGTFDHKGELTAGPINANLRFTKFKLAYANRIGDGLSMMAGQAGTTPFYSASFETESDKQDYDVQSILSSSSETGVDDAGKPID